MRFRHSVWALGALMVAASIPAAGAPAVAHVETIKAVTVMSYGHCASDLVIWDHLNENWSQYGSVPIAIDYDNPTLCGDGFTLADLEASEADVVILSDPVGGNGHHFTAAQVLDLQTYVREGHTLIGTYGVFGTRHYIDNRALAPLFGLVQDDDWAGGMGVTTYTLRTRKHLGPASALFRGLPRDYASEGSGGYSQLPGDRHWSRNDLAGARIIARSASERAAITVYSRSTYEAIYVAGMPEFFSGNTADKQFMYNAIIFPRRS